MKKSTVIYVAITAVLLYAFYVIINTAMTASINNMLAILG